MLEERRAIRALLETLTPEQWATPSLCAEWTVRDLVAHLVAWDDLIIYRNAREHRRALVRFMWLYAVSFASMRRLNRRLNAPLDGVPVAELLRRFGAEDDPGLRWLFDGSNPGAHYAEYVIHHEDIRRPLGLAREVPADRVAAAIEGARRLPGVRLHARRRRPQDGAPSLDDLLVAGGRAGYT
ncbi:MAG TPA: maleylpyruvate isomerase family mycothiol-dependent enzyme [Acidimicrobiales bacterium]|nr:maleylpyruvate isomerase family mycothiol-dependent enzyme [Acidimicrobiales bacterium]